MIDGIDLNGPHEHRGAGDHHRGVKVPLGLWDGSTENTTVATALLADLVDRGLDVEQGVLFVIDGSKALRAAVNTVLGPRPRCSGACVTRNATCSTISPERDRPAVKAPASRVGRDDHDRALEQLRRSRALKLDHAHPGAAASLSEGMAETLTVIAPRDPRQALKRHCRAPTRASR